MDKGKKFGVFSSLSDSIMTASTRWQKLPFAQESCQHLFQFSYHLPCHPKAEQKKEEKSDEYGKA